MEQRKETKMSNLMNRATKLFNDPKFQEATDQQMGFEISQMGVKVDNEIKYLWDAAWSEARAEANPEMLRNEMQAEADYIDGHCFGL